MKFNKPAYTPDQHIKLLESRGMTLVDHDRAKRYLTTIGYYRLSAYFLSFLEEKDKFKADVQFSGILDLCTSLTGSCDFMLWMLWNESRSQSGLCYPTLFVFDLALTGT
jgi:hypothetical protein